MREHGRRRQRLTALFLSLLFLCACAGRGPEAPAETGPVTTTLMVYMTGSDLETKAGAASADLEEMRAALPEDGSLRVVVLASGARTWHSAVAADAANIYELTRDGLRLHREGEAASMGAPETLEALLRCGYEDFPAERWALLLWDHGAGPMLGLCFDEMYSGPSGMDSLSLEELAGALAASPFAERKLAWIGFDACLMACGETAWAVAPYAEYMIASQELEPAGGWDYAFLRGVPLDASGADTGYRAVEAYRAACRDSLGDAALSCLDLGAMAPLAAELTALFGSFSVTAETYPRFAAVRAAASAVGYAAPYDYDLVDLGNLLRGLEAAGLGDCAGASRKLEEAVVCAWASREDRCGLSLYYPFRNRERYLSPWGSLRARLPGSEGYGAFLEACASLWLGEALVNWDRPHPAEAEEAGERIRLTLQLTREEAENLASARLVVVDEDVPREYFRVWLSEEVNLSPQGLLWCDYGSEALFFTDGEGRPQSSALFYWLLEDCLAIPANVYNLSGEEGKPRISGWTPDGTNMPFLLVYRQDGEENWRLLHLLEIDDTGERYGKSTLRLEDWEILQTTSRGRHAPAGEGSLPPFLQWEPGRTWYGWEERVEDLGALRFLPVQDDSPRYAFFELTDLQGNCFATEMIPLPNPGRQELPLEPRTLLDCPDCTISLESAVLVRAEEPILRLDFWAVNRGETPLRLQLEELRCGSVPLPEYVCYAWLEAGGSRSLRLDLPVGELRDKGIALLKELTLTARCVNDDRASEDRGPVLGEAEGTVPLELDLRGLGETP